MKKMRWFRLFMAMAIALSLITVDVTSVLAKTSSRSSGGFSGGSRSGGFNGGMKASPSVKTSGGFSGGIKSPPPVTPAVRTSAEFSGRPSVSPPVAPAVKTSAGFSGEHKVSPAEPIAKTSAGFSGGPKAPVAQTTPGSPMVAPKKDAAAAAKTAAISREQSRKAMAEYQAQQSKFNRTGSPVNASPTTQRTVINRTVINNYRYDRGAYAYRTRTFYAGYGWAPPAYGYGSFFPSYGLWNTVALWFMLDHIVDHQYAMMYYSHRHDPDMMAWRQQAEIEARNNAELRAKLAAMDQRVLAMERQGVQKDPGYVPPEMKEVALSESALQDAQPQPQQPLATPAVYSQPIQSRPEKSGMPWGWILLGVVVVGGVVYFGYIRKY